VTTQFLSVQHLHIVVIVPKRVGFLQSRILSLVSGLYERNARLGGAEHVFFLLWQRGFELNTRSLVLRRLVRSERFNGERLSVLGVQSQLQSPISRTLGPAGFPV